MLQNMRKSLGEDMPDSEYNWDLMDGLEECPPDVQAKFKKAIIDGKIADEDFRGDPEWNVLGQKGLRPIVRKKKEVPGTADEEVSISQNHNDNVC